MNLSADSGADDFARRCRLLEFGASLPALLGILAYLSLVSSMAPWEWIALASCLLVYVVVAGLAAPHLHRDQIDAIRVRFEAKDPSSASSEEEKAVAAARAMLALPVRMRRMRFLTMFAMALGVPASMRFLGFESWPFGPHLQSFLLVSLVAALLASTLQYYWAQSSFRELRSQLVPGVETSWEGSSSGGRTSLARKISFAIVMPALASSMLLVHFVSERQAWMAEREAVDWSAAALEPVADGARGDSLSERLEKHARARESWPLPVEIVAISSSDGAASLAGALSSEFLESLDRLLAEPDGAKAPLVSGSREVGTYHRSEDGVVLVATVDRSALVAGNLGSDAGAYLLCLGLIALALAMAGLVGLDLGSTLDGLGQVAEGLAAGDLRAHATIEADDELGDLGCALARLGANMRETVNRFQVAMEEVEGRAEDALSIVEGLSTQSSTQLQTLLSANELIGSIEARAQDVSRSADGLNESIDESSSSVAELGAAGAELNETASVLSSKIDEVSESMEQMVRSVKQVGATTEELAAASEDTSSSMEEMASAMRVVDTSAETMANLSRDVVEKAEVGQAKVCQTIEGMEAIRDATDTAERVIRGLAARTQEIGGILDVIDDVADETNLLALNAAIIAAQAGEQGKAFSVVADEIKELADRVLASTKEIGGLIRAVQEESENAIGAIEAGSESVMSGVDLSAEAGRTLEEITDASRENGMRIGEIVSSVREQTRAASHVVVLMERVRDSSDEIAAASSQQGRGNEIIYRSALTMRDVAQQVRVTTEEQSRGFGRIRESVEGVRSIVERINGSLEEQSGACGRVATCLEEMSQGSRSSDEAAQRVAGGMKSLRDLVGSIRQDVERFRIS